jgi:hypothetical protein
MFFVRRFIYEVQVKAHVMSMDDLIVWEEHRD